MGISIVEKTGLNDMLGQIKEIFSVDEILAFIKKIDALKIALEAAETFRQQSIKYAKMEAEALIRAVELGGLNSLRGYHKKTADWLYGLSEYERDKYILMCEDGLTIDQVYKREVGDVYALNHKIERIQDHRDNLIEECKKNGIVDIKEFASSVRDTFKFERRSIGEDIIDGTRNRLRKAGAVGIGGDTGIYVMRCKNNSAEIKEALILRYRSICDDFESIEKIAKASGQKMSYKDFDNGSHWSYHNNSYIIHILIALMRLGIISDEEECYSAILKSDFRSEMEAVTKHLRYSREKYIKAEYDKILKEHSDETQIDQ